jgi:hypothetical protein
MIPANNDMMPNVKYWEIIVRNWIVERSFLSLMMPDYT